MASLGTVLVCDDQQDNLDLLVASLGPLGYEVLPALDGPTALAIARRSQPDVVLLDVMMPEMDGFEVCRRLKADVDTRLLPVVFVTGLDSREARLRGLDAGATEFLSKPFDLTELEVRVRNLVSFRRLTQDLDSAEQMLFAIARAVEARDEGTRDHCDRLSHLAARLGERLGLDAESLRSLRRAGYLHDIGKIGIPDAILRKPGKLTAPEWEIMKQHPVIAYNILSKIKFLEEPTLVVLYHHEQFAGGGYPYGLAGEQIPIGARIFHIVDMLDAVTSDRPYCKARSFQEAFEEIRRSAGTLFDPEVVKAFNKINIKWWSEERDRINEKIKELPDFF
jgi:putative two-component system response regulator